jgi:hypothetical protein
MSAKAHGCRERPAYQRNHLSRMFLDLLSKLIVPSNEIFQVNLEGVVIHEQSRT